MTDESWRQELITENLQLVPFLIRKRIPHVTLTDDMVSEGYVGLVIAASRFDRNRKLQFSTYAVHWVSAMVHEHLMRTRGPVRCFTRAQERKVYFNLNKARKEVGDDLDDLAAYLSVDKSIIEIAWSRMYPRDVHIDATRGGVGSDKQDPDARTFELVDETTRPDTLFSALEADENVKDRIRLAMDRLPERERYVVFERYLSPTPKTLAQLGAELGTSRERVRQVEVRALERLKKTLSYDVHLDKSEYVNAHAVGE